MGLFNNSLFLDIKLFHEKNILKWKTLLINNISKLMKYIYGLPD